MNNILEYKGYAGSVNFDSDDRIFYGRVLGIEDVIGFEGTDADTLEADFRNAVDDYIETCQEIGKSPEKPFSGKIILEIPPDLYLAVSAAASRQRKSIDVWITEACRKMAEQ
jgi:predicted HicB family RNase H-like nuclease